MVIPLPQTPEEMAEERAYIRDERLGMLGVHGNMRPTVKQLELANGEADDWCYDLEFERWRRTQK